MIKRRGRVLLAALMLMVAGSGMVSPARAALGEPLQTAPTAWWWYVGQTPAQVSALINSHNARLVSLRVQSANPLLFDVAVVQNTGTYAKTWWWYYGVAEQELEPCHGERCAHRKSRAVRGGRHDLFRGDHAAQRGSGLERLVVVLRIERIASLELPQRQQRPPDTPVQARRLRGLWSSNDLEYRTESVSVVVVLRDHADPNPTVRNHE